MKNKVLVAAMLSILSAGANASVIEFKGSLFGGNDFEFDLMDYTPEGGINAADIVQTDDGTGNILGTDGFSEIGGTDVVGFTNDGVSVGFLNPGLHGMNIGFGNTLDVNYGIYFEYSVGGSAGLDVSGDLAIDFDTVNYANLYVLWDADANSTAADKSWETRVDLASFDLQSGDCDISAAIDAGTGAVTSGDSSACKLNLLGNFAPTFFFDQYGNDLSTYVENPVYTTYDATVQSINGLNFNYGTGNAALDEQGNAIEGTQKFTVSHDANMSFNVPEPTSLAILGLGLLGLAGVRRKS